MNNKNNNNTVIRNIRPDSRLVVEEWPSGYQEVGNGCPLWAEVLYAVHEDGRVENLALGQSVDEDEYLEARDIAHALGKERRKELFDR